MTFGALQLVDIMVPTRTVWHLAGIKWIAVALVTQGHDSSQLSTINPGGLTHSSVTDDYLFNHE
jgi:hypothetical protein